MNSADKTTTWVSLIILKEIQTLTKPYSNYNITVKLWFQSSTSQYDQSTKIETLESR